MNRFIGKIDNGKVKVVTLTSGDPKKALVNFIFQFQNNNGTLKKSDINKQIKKTANRYYYNEYFISRGTNNE